MTIGIRLKARRKEKKLTQQELAASAGVSQSTISDLENDAFEDPDKIEAGTIFKVAMALDMNPHYLRHGVGPVELIDTRQDDDEILSIWRRLSLTKRSALIAAGLAMIEK